MSITKRKLKQGGYSYRVKIFDKGLVVQEKSFRRKADAVHWEERMFSLYKSGVDSHVDISKIRLVDFIWIWFESVSSCYAPATQRKLYALIEKRIAPYFSDSLLSQVTYFTVVEFLNSCGTSVGTPTIRQLLGILRQTFDFALRQNIVTNNPAIGIRLRAEQGNDPKPLSWAQLWLLVDNAQCQRDRTLLLLAGTTGLRWGEIAGLSRNDINLSQRLLFVKRSYSEVPGHKGFRPVKTHQTRVIALPQVVVVELEKLFNQNISSPTLYSPLQFSTTSHNYSPTSPLVFSTKNSSPLSNRNFRRSVLTPLSQKFLGYTVTPHHLRDTAASLCISAGASVVTVSKLLGHQSSATTLNHYAGMFNNDLHMLSLEIDKLAIENRPFLDSS